MTRSATPQSRMVEIKHGEQDVAEGEQLTLAVRRDCDAEYLRRATAFIRNARRRRRSSSTSTTP